VHREQKQVWRAVERIREQLATADSELRRCLLEELNGLRELGDRRLQEWLELDTVMSELLAEFGGSDSEDTGTADTPLGVFPSIGGTVAIGTDVTSDLEAGGQEPGEWLQLILPDPDPFVDPLTVSLRTGLGYFDLSMFEQAIAALTQAVGHDPAGHPARLFLAAALLAQGHTEAALAQVQWILRTRPEPIVFCAAHEISAQAHFQKRQMGEAVASLQEILAVMPDYTDTWYNLGVCYALEGDWLAAAAALSQALEVDGCLDAEAAVLLATVRLRAGDPCAAGAICQQVLALQPRHPRALRLLWRLAADGANWSQARAYARRLLAATPEADDTWARLAFSEFHCDYPGEAVALLKKALSLTPNSPALQTQLGVLLWLTGDESQAERVLRSLPEAEHSPLIKIVLARIDIRRGQWEPACERLGQALTQADHPGLRRLALYSYGLALMGNGRLNEAAHALRSAAELGPTNPAIDKALSQVREGLDPTLIDRRGFTVHATGGTPDVKGLPTQSATSSTAHSPFSDHL
jgi:tetratricopeptide (TPR) repeat protein